MNQMQQRIFVDCVNCVVKLINDKSKRLVILDCPRCLISMTERERQGFSLTHFHMHLPPGTAQ